MTTFPSFRYTRSLAFVMGVCLLSGFALAGTVGGGGGNILRSLPSEAEEYLRNQYV